MKRFLSAAMLCVFALSGSAPGDSPEKDAPAKKEYSHEHRFVFYAILEGLYEDGVSDAALKLIVPDPKSMANLKRPGRTNFIPGCPLCTPAFDAFCAYRARPVFVGEAASKTNTFGGGLPEETLEGLRGSPAQRRETIRQLIEKYVARRLDSLNLEIEEREDITLRLRELKLKGQMALLRVQMGEEGEELKKVYAGWKVCPNCVAISPEVKE